MLRAILTGFAVLAFGQGAIQTALADDYSDTEHNFRITVPNGWPSEKNPTEDIRLIMGSAKREQTGGTCNVVTEANPGSKTMSQEQIDAALDTEVNDAAWLDMFKSVIFLDNIVIEKSGSERRHGRKAFYVLVTFETTVPGMPLRHVKAKQYMHAIPGEIFFVTCSASQDTYAQEEDDFKTVFDSFAPLADTVAAAEPSGVPSLTLYAQANFSGVSRVLTQDTPDLALFGWHDNAASASVAGADFWQVCDGPNYTGRCRVVTNAVHSDLGQKGLAIASVRHLPPTQAHFALMLQAGGARSVQAALRGK